MNKAFSAVISALIKPLHLETCIAGEASGGTARLLNATFLAALAGAPPPALRHAFDFSQQWDGVARFYHDGAQRVRQELDHVTGTDPAWTARLQSLAEWVGDESNLLDAAETCERCWQVFFPEGAGVLPDRASAVQALRRQQSVIVTKANAAPLTSPRREVLFTFGALLAPPAEGRVVDNLPHSSHFKSELARAMQEGQRFWTDRPIEIGVKADKNPLLRVVRGLDGAVRQAVDDAGGVDGGRATCVLALAGTHPRLQGIAREYVTHELGRNGKPAALRICLLTEPDALRLIDEVLVPAAERYLERQNAADDLGVFGVEGDGGRPYTFQKAVAALWQVLIDPQIKATFSVDSQHALPAIDAAAPPSTPALAPLATPLWGAYGIATGGIPIEFGLLAGMVTARDATSVPEVSYPDPASTPEQLIAFHPLTDALATDVERLCVEPASDDGERCALRARIPDSGNGILVDHLRRYRPFAPSFVRRGAAAAFVLAALARPGARLACLNRPALALRSIAQPAPTDAADTPVDAQLADYLDTLYLSTYAESLTGGRPDRIKGALDPFTSGFISSVPATVIYLHFALHAETLFSTGQINRATQFVTRGAVRLHAALDFAGGRQSALRQTVERERRGWELFYTVLGALEKALDAGDEFALDLRSRARTLIDSFMLP